MRPIHAIVLATLALGACVPQVAPPSAVAELPDLRGPWGELHTPRVRVPIEDAAARGAAAPLVTLVVFTDFECPYCRVAAPTIDRLLVEHAADVRIALRHLPLPFHEHANLAAQATEEARAQGGDRAFWAFHDRLFQTPDSMELDDLVAHAEGLGLDVARFRRALVRQIHSATIEDDLDLADRVGANGTPTMYLNGRPVFGAVDYAELERVYEEEAALARDAIERGIPRSLVYAAAMRESLVRAPRRPREPRRPAEARPPNPERVAIPVPEHAPLRGAAEPQLVVQVFTDFECPFCSRVLPTLARLLEEFPQVQLAFRHYPLPFHADARPAAIAAIEVREELGDAAFWAFHDHIFEEGALDRASLLAAARAVGADPARVERALDDGTHEGVIDADIAAVREAGLRIGTPAFLIGERPLMGARPYADFEVAVREELDSAGN